MPRESGIRQLRVLEHERHAAVQRYVVEAPVPNRTIAHLVCRMRRRPYYLFRPMTAPAKMSYQLIMEFIDGQGAADERGAEMGT